MPAPVSPIRPGINVPERVPWTPERIIEHQQETIAHWRQRARSAEKMVEALQRYGGREAWLKRLAKAVLRDVAAERDELDEVAGRVVALVDELLTERTGV